MPTFLFTDIESSTRMWEEHPDTMTGALERHDAILRDAITAAGGSVLKTTGDGAIGVFDTTSDAVAAAIAAQRALQTESWGTTPVRVRMGVHAGEVTARGGDFFGPVMNRAARIMAAGHGDQILLSEIARASMGVLPSGATVKDLGPHRLKDLTLPEHLFQLVHPDLRADFPAPRTLDARPNNLPVQATDLIGRAQELATMRSLLDAPGTRLLTIAGPGGAGKTRLGLQLAADVADAFPDGVFFVDLSAEHDPDAAFETIVRSLSLPIARSGDALETLKNRLRDREILIVLDNFEQVVAAATGLSELLVQAPALKVIVTSRETLNVRAERVYHVPPLSLPNPDDPPEEIARSAAVELFADRALAVNPGFAIDATNASTIARICLRLDGLPLAIELATARLSVFSPADLLARINDRLDVLGAGGRDLPDRQRTLWGAIAWSYELLTDDERALFALLSVFATTRLASVESVAREILGADPPVIDTLSSLVAKSLVRRTETTGTVTFSMLQVVKEYAAERLADIPASAARATETHARFFADFVTSRTEPVRTPERQSALRELELEMGNVRPAWRYWVERGDHRRLHAMIDPLWALLDARGWYHDAIDLVRDMLHVLDTAERSPERAGEELTLWITLGRALMAVHGYNLEVEQAYRRALELATAAGDDRERIPVLRSLASYYVQTADTERAIEIGHELLQIGRASGDRAVETEGHSVLGSALIYFQPAECLAHLREVIDRHDPSDRRIDRYRLGPDIGVIARMSTAIMLWETGRLDAAMGWIESSLAFADRIDHPYSLAWALYHAGFMAAGREAFDECLSLAGRLAVVAREHDYLLWQTLATVLEGVGRTARGETEEGVMLTEQGIDLYQGLAPPPIFWPFLLGLRASVHAMAGHPVRALELVDEAIAIWAEAPATPPELWLRRADLLQMIGDPAEQEVVSLYERALAESADLGLHLTEVKAAARLAELRRRLGQSTDTAELVRALESIEGDHDPEVTAARRHLG